MLFIISTISILAHSQVDHKKLDALLKTYVNAEGFVDYSQLSKKKREILDIVSIYSKVKPESLSKEDQLAFYINLYNIHTIYKIISHYPIKSIKDLDGGKPWDQNTITLGNKKLSLNDIENKIIRPTFKDARIHFALNCGAVSCPVLLNGAYMGSSIYSQLDAQTKKFINNQKFNTISSNKLNLSKVFEWYKADFGNIIEFISKYVKIKLNAGASITHVEYNWSLNGK
ncbi:MAG: hypothetical protein RLZZ546_222 [Bacteroidota bacterium]